MLSTLAPAMDSENARSISPHNAKMNTETMGSASASDDTALSTLPVRGGAGLEAPSATSRFRHSRRASSEHRGRSAEVTVPTSGGNANSTK